MNDTELFSKMICIIAVGKFGAHEAEVIMSQIWEAAPEDHPAKDRARRMVGIAPFVAQLRAVK